MVHKILYQPKPESERLTENSADIEGREGIRIIFSNFSHTRLEMSTIYIYIKLIRFRFNKS